MRTLLVLSASLLALAASPARAQLSNHGIAVESGVSVPLGAGAPTAVPVAISTALWLDVRVDLVLRLSMAAASRPEDRGAAGWIAGTAGVRWSLAPGPVRPQLFAELGWARRTGGGGRDAVALGAGAALEWFLARDLSVALAAAARRGPGGGGARLDGGLSLAAYF